MPDERSKARKYTWHCPVADLGQAARWPDPHKATSESIWEKTLLSASEQRVFRTFRQYLMRPGKMLCFSGPNLERDTATLKLLTEKKLLVKEKFKGAYSLTPAGFEAMKHCESGADTPS